MFATKLEIQKTDNKILTQPVSEAEQFDYTSLTFTGIYTVSAQTRMSILMNE